MFGNVTALEGLHVTGKYRCAAGVASLSAIDPCLPSNPKLSPFAHSKCTRLGLRKGGGGMFCVLGSTAVEQEGNNLQD